MDNLNHTVERYNMLSIQDIRKIVEAVIPFGANPFMYRDGYMFAFHTDEGTEASALRHNSTVEFARQLSDMWEMETSKILVRIETLDDPDGFVSYCQSHLTSDTVTCFKTTPFMFEFQSPFNSMKNVPRNPAGLSAGGIGAIPFRCTDCVCIDKCGKSIISAP